jgi:diphosphomevalonate decarboxylase
MQNFKTSWTSPANIAFVKYWGKKAYQIPANPSLSMTLKECATTTEVHFSSADKLSVQLKLQDLHDEKFSQKIKTFLEKLTSEFSFLAKTSFDIKTSNTFPHGAGIASSASGLSAFALCLAEFIEFKTEKQNVPFFQRASYLSRLASGSACRSVYGGYVSWGDQSDEYATSVEAHPCFKKLHDTILVISSEEKKVSSTSGHGFMSDHFFAQSRFAQARHNFTDCLSALKCGDMEKMGEILEMEALSLHAMMLTSPTPYTLLKPKSLEAIDKIWKFRAETKLPLYFTLDAGPNLHLIYSTEFQAQIHPFIQAELKPLTEKIIEDQTGEGPKK